MRLTQIVSWPAPLFSSFKRPDKRNDKDEESEPKAEAPDEKADPPGPGRAPPEGGVDITV
ncbi:MAG: hypothetical protein ACREEW_03145 [Caulobacteraceae bacterium]